MGRIEPLPDGTRLLHVGPPKTATTSIQASFHASRPALAEHSVVYAGKTRHSRAAATAAAMEKLSVEFSPAALENWQVLAGQIQASDARVTVLSSEGLSYANEERARRIVGEVGGSAHVVITMRSPARMAPSVWQQKVRRGSAQPLSEWLEQTFARQDGELTAPHWNRFGLDRLIATWSAAVGAENVAVVVVDPTDHDAAHHAFEDLVAVPRGTLGQVPRMANESFPYPELEMIRQFNEAFYAAGGTRKEWLESIRRYGLFEIRQARGVEFTGPKVEAPRWVAEQANEMANGWISLLADHPGRVLGDPAKLLVDASAYQVESVPPADVPIASAGLLAHVMYDAARTRAEKQREAKAHKAKAAPRPSPVAAVASPSNRRRATSLARGVKRRLTAAVRALTGR